MNILFIGHSLIEFFDWQGRFPLHQVANLGVAGETVEGLLSRIGSITGQHPSADIIFIMSGLNDVAMEEFGFAGSYRKIVEKLIPAYPQARIFIHSLLPTNVEFITDKSIQDVNRSLKELAKDTGVEYLDIYSIFINEEGAAISEYLLDDGVHLSDKGYDAWAGVLEGIINRTS
ncbi:MAG: GDSL family lipase [Nitrospirae bacterium]|nr:GDSL family lipase [Nitrospirota bacterium]